MKFKRGYYDVFVRACAKYPRRIAVRQYDYGEYKLYTYSELYGVCEYIAQNLQQLQCNRGGIGLVSERNVIVPCAIAAAHKCCTTFMFLDSSQDMNRVADTMKFQIVIKISKEENTSLDEHIMVRKPDTSVSVFGYNIGFYLCDFSSSRHSCKQGYSFIAMTSGSTGEPKHIQVPVQCLQPNIDDLTKLFNITSNDVIYFSTPLTFDPSMVEILLACMNGASLLIAPDNTEILFPENHENSVTVWQTTPSRFFQYTNTNIKNKILSANSTLKILALGGEPLNGVKTIKALKDCDNKTKIFALYGVTEMSCWACAAELDFTNTLIDREIPLGQCLSETEIVVEPTKDKNMGKIILVSKTRKCIVLNRLEDNVEVNALKYLDTGDLAEVRNGTIYYRGRKDDIIKRFGHKINLQAIECAIMQCPKVKMCSCVWLPKPMLLVAYFSSETIDSNEMSDFLKCKLDDKHWPDKIVRVANMPTNVHGKVSKMMLSKLYQNCPQKSPQAIPSLKVSLLQELKTALNSNFTYDDIKDKDFFTLGGTSFLAVSMCNKISVTNPQFGKLILPYLISPKYTIDEIMDLAEQEVGVDLKKAKKKLKRSASETESSETHTRASKKAPAAPSTSSNKPVEFCEMWSYDTGKCVDGSPTLLLSGSKLYVVVGSHSGKVIVFDALSGVLQGIVKVKARVEASVLCYEEPPSGAPCGVVGAYDGTVVCFALDDGREKWRANAGCMIKSKATIYNGFLYCAAYDGVVRCIDIMTGALKYSICVADQAISADLVLAKNEYILTGTLSGVCASIHAETNSVAWRSTVDSPIFASPVLYDSDRYVVFAEVNGDIHCRTVDNGIKIWKFQGAKGNIFSSICVREVGKLKWQMVFGCHDSRVYSINVKNSQPSLHWKTKLTAEVYSTPCSLSDTLLLAASKNGIMYVMDSENGRILGEYQLPNETFSSPAVLKDYVYIGCRDDHLHGYRCVLNFSC